jgi:hypothetical protein
MVKSSAPVSAYCRKCGGDRNHTVRCQFSRETQNSEEDAVDAWEEWQILQCRGCNTVSVVRENWNTDETDERGQPEVQVEIFPPPPTGRKEPEWLGAHGFSIYRGVPIAAMWIPAMHEDIYRALGLHAFGLAAMGARAIIDFIVTSQAGDSGTFKKKLERMCDKGLISAVQVDIIDAAWEAGSAAAHRGHIPEADEVNTLLDITENLIERTYVEPQREKQRAKAAAALRAKTPPRARQKPPS